MSNFLYTFRDWMLANEEAFSEGGGLFSFWHILLIIVMAIAIVGVFLFAKKHKQAALKTTTILCYIMMISRLFRMILLWATGTNTFVEILPWHLCHVMAFVFPAFFLTKTKKFFYPILIVTFYGGLLTFVFGNYYVYNIPTFLDIESILLHFMMMFVSVSCIASGYYKVKFSEVWQVFVALGLLIAHASLGNYLCEGQNYLYLKENGLPFNLFKGAHHIFTYIILVLVLFVATYTPMTIKYLYNKRKALNIKEKDEERQV